MATLPIVIDPSTGGSPVSAPPVGVIPPRAFTCTISTDSKTLYLIFPPNAGMRKSGLALDIRIYYIDGTKVSPDQIAFPAGFQAAKVSQSSFVMDTILAGEALTISLNAAPYVNGGWFWALSYDVNSAAGAVDPSTGPVAVAQNSVNTAPPGYQVSGASVAVSSVTIFGVACKQLLFSWVNPTTLDVTNPLAYVLIVMYNYRTLAEYEEIIRFYCNPVRSMPAATSNVGANGVYNSLGPIYLISDHDGLHNVTFYFVVENAALQHAPNYAAIPAASYAVVGGV
jgi:hypothetical protein